MASGGIVRINGTRVSAASQPVRTGDVVTVALDRVRVLKVAGFAERRGGASDAARLFEDLQPAVPERSSTEPPSPAATSRPDRRERREILRLKHPRHD